MFGHDFAPEIFGNLLVVVDGMRNSHLFFSEKQSNNSPWEFANISQWLGHTFSQHLPRGLISANNSTKTHIPISLDIPDTFEQCFIHFPDVRDFYPFSWWFYCKLSFFFNFCNLFRRYLVPICVLMFDQRLLIVGDTVFGAWRRGRKFGFRKVKLKVLRCLKHLKFM